MTKLFIISTFIFVSTINVSSQDWYQIGTEWYFNKEILLDYPAHGYVKYTVEKDTMIDLQDAKTVIRKSYGFSSGNIIDIDTLFVREENRQIFRWDGDEFILMYDFSLNQGDTLDVDVVKYSTCDSVSQIVVDSIGILEIDGIQLDVQFLSYTAKIENQIEVITDRVIERIGRIEEFNYFPACGILDTWGTYLLRCYVDNELSFHSDWWSNAYPDAPCDTTIDGSTGIKLPQHNGKLSVYPNPFHDFINIDCPNSVIISLKLFNSSGYLLSNLNPLVTSLQINTMTLKSGIYFILIETNNHSVSKIILKQ